MCVDEKCDFPICLLLNNNVQVCDVLIKMNTKTKDYTIYHDDDISKEDAKNLCNSFQIIMKKLTKDKRKLKVGDGVDLSTNKYDFFIDLKRSNLYKVCFHAKNEEETVSEEDPIEVK